MLDSLIDKSAFSIDLSKKQAIANAFGRAAQHYDKSAAFQRQVGHQLLSLMPTRSSAISTPRVIDIGCGTGYFSAMLHQQGFAVTAADLSTAMLLQAQQRCGKDCQYLQTDAEKIVMADHSYDLAFSNLALQWCDDLSVPLRELRRVVRPEGRIFFTTLIDGSLGELKQAWSQIDTQQHVNTFKSQHVIAAEIARSGLVIEALEYKPITVYYPTAMKLMKDLKGIGATHLHQQRQSGLVGRQTFIDLEDAYERFRLDNGLLPATYQVCFGVLINE
ncbi:malonyl-ACP O-methyltransferase BioC [Photobacterium kishitanii]|uniref:malonyl-ACP O-methyltransferase BioC n=1 Tax=Photobacterium kishitanii TaxID=318456 RepID=UPI0005D2F09C|nr:malonyl-ACP O-methyltransferase BioC [Photobacterium kishitanii]KJG11452.1 biotin synthase [Photobacterium kishitanii]OBU34474.1 malonyl-[acyl-carrier protein] O-methyltransferase BioC [Photobacterium kishitanii]PSU23285.1 malonyl-[acyl-carrier protein] O-methyltransferase BioC [Photobacterium kishitanii]PSV05878.1 malonyl-[acyl-carrier protein] O-methyltransferase BioC [Photobacterium kishitanii]PSV75764.1 malonyl-[acyl-carrier protein] O-methyltransferase BioC [Photobacterium kishitanii]